MKFPVALAAILIATLILCLPASPVAPSSAKASSSVRITPDRAAKSIAGEAYNRLPLSFEENRGQVTERVKFISRNGDGAIFLTPSEAVIEMRSQKSEVRSQKSEVRSQSVAAAR